MFLDQVIHFGKNLGNQLKGHSPVFSNSGKFGRSGKVSFAKNQVKGRFPKKLKWLIEVLHVLQVKEDVLSFSMILISSP